MKKIMFNDRYGLTRAVIESRKTMTRRMISGNPLLSADHIEEARYFAGFIQIVANDGESLMEVKSRYKVGEIVAVAQSYEQVYRQGNMDADDAIIMGLKYDPGMSNKMFVRADLMPRQIRITGVRCERLQDISEEDCLKEGIRYIPEINKFYFEDVRREEGFYFDNPHEAFAALIDKVSGKGTWQANPWVVVYEFELMR